MRATSGSIRVDDVTKVLGLDRPHAAKLLAGWHKQGVIRRISRGLYVAVQPTALGQAQVLEDPWVLVPDLYAPGYIGGWSALEYWDLTEQLFRSICVLTSKRTTYGELTHQGVNFFVKYIPGKRLFGTKTIWRGNVKIQISDAEKTILDIIDDPKLGAGLQHLTDCLIEYKKTHKEPDDLSRLLEYAIKINNGALFKKLGFLAEKLGFESAFLKTCTKHLTTGYAYLDKDAKENKLVTKWRLWVPTGYEL
jgi:predicted transcriptional regulator of viral defense system